MRYMVRFAVLATVTTLAACGGGGSGGPTTSPPGDPARVSFAEMRKGLLAIDEKVGFYGSVMTPKQGRATYNGYMTGGQDLEAAQSDPQFASRVQLKANFDRQTMDGRFYQFADKGNNPVRGELNLSNGKIERGLNDGDVFAADVAGRLTNVDGTRINVSGKTGGSFHGKGATAVAGALTVSDDANHEAGLVGIFVATR
ncbi:MAG: transferrin-binding protein-like solute binding protein [Paracoccus sp. (in: a-proteobacteria)]|nr:transferrin-binding protein-like solute binding protein [Paracoccus sp. (in: a-proteobacteria)]